MPRFSLRSRTGHLSAPVRALAVLLALQGTCACQSSSKSQASAVSDAGGGGDPLALLPLHAQPDSDHGGAIVDELGRTVLLRGVNVNALADYWKGTEFDTTFPLTDEDIDQMAGIGWNAVRLLISWSKVEPSPGSYDEAYLSTVDDAIRRFAARHMYVIVDLHQDAWSATLAARADEACSPPSTPAVGWDGAPAWATQDGGNPRCAPGIRELSTAVRAAWGAFLTDSPGPEGIGIRTRYATMLGTLAHRYAKEPAVAGFDLVNEPNAFGPEQNDSLAALYTDAMHTIRAAEQDAAGFSHLVLFEPGALWSTTGNGPPPTFEYDQNVVYAPHVYTGGFGNGPITFAAFQTALTEAQGFGGAPILSGEWGTGPERALPTGDGYFLDHLAFQDQARVSSTLWTWRESCGDPHHAADYLAGRVATVWGEFEVDCKTNTVTGVRQELVAQLTRGVVRTAPGSLESVRFDDGSGTFEVRGTADAAGAELVVFFPASRFPDQTAYGNGIEDIRKLPAPGGNDYFVAKATGGAWSFTVGRGFGDAG